ncbi:MAG: enoyl-CoA hydratase/isomerase family protein [Planctomycetota bacterium]|nr:enoyl-CoA hydratase/isomerase family protein [Planctomycetota bacterium]
MGEFLRVSHDGAVATITFAREKGLNILSIAVLKELGAAWNEIEKQGKTRVCILHGEGKVFVAGADIKEMSKLDPKGALDFAALGQHVFQSIELSPIVSIAAMHGAALGGGCELALACDLRIAADDLKIGQPEVNLGLIPGFGGTQRLPRVIGQGRALFRILTGEPYNAQMALAVGLVNEVTSSENLMNTARHIAGTIVSRGPQAVATAKALVRGAFSRPLQDGLLNERDSFAKTFASGEAQEGMAAFVEKRAPAFKFPN